MNEVAGTQDIRRRIRSATNMQQITKAMKMVAASKLRRAQNKLIASRPYARQLQGVLGRLAQAPVADADELHPLLKERPVEKIAYVVVTADRGLCGGYNANIIRLTSGMLAEEKREVKLVSVGRKGRDFFVRRKVAFLGEYIGLGDDPNYNQAKEIGRKIVSLYEEGEADEVYLVYSEFVSAMTQRPSQVKLLPIAPEESEAPKDNVDYIFEPSPDEILNSLLPRYVETQVFRAIIEGKASELGAKMMAMSAATDNAKDVIARLTLDLNRARQAAITTEISEIVSGAAALE